MSSREGRRKTTHTADDLVSVSVRIDETNRHKKAGISLVERKGAILVTKIAEDGLFHGTEVGVGDIVLSLNGKRIRKGQAPAEIVKAIAKNRATFTMVIKKADRKARRGIRSLSPSKQRQLRRQNDLKRNYKGLRRQNADGSLKLYNPNDQAWAKEEVQVEEVTIFATKLFAKQAAGIRFRETDGKIYVSSIAPDSIFRDTKLDVGDRIIQVNEMNFRDYATKAYAEKIMSRAKEEIEFVVEKGSNDFEESMSSLQDLEVEEQQQRDMNSSFSRKLRILKGKGKESDNEQSDDDNGGDNNGTANDVLRLDDIRHDFLRVRLGPRHRGPTGIRFIRRGGKLFIKSLPESERRFTIGDEILAINQTKSRQIMTSDLAEKMIDQTVGGAFILVNFDDPKARKFDCPCCGELIKVDAAGNAIKSTSMRAGRSRSIPPAPTQTENSVAASEATKPVSNRGRSGYDSATRSKRKTKEQAIQGKYDLAEFHSDSESDSGDDDVDDSDINDSESSSSSDSDSDNDDSSSDGNDSQYAPNEKFLVSVRKTRNKQPGIRFLEYKGDLFVSAISEAGLFHDTKVKVGDQTLSVNGKKAGGIVDASFVEDILDAKDRISIYFKRLDCDSPLGQSVMNLLR